MGPSPPPDAEFDRLKSKWGIYRPLELKERCEKAGTVGYLIDGLIPESSLGLIVGDSGLGKSPLAYQMGMCVAAGVPFLGAAVQKTRVLFLDFENGSQDVNYIIGRLAKHLGLPVAPPELVLWNVNDCLPTWGGTGHTGLDLIRDLKPGLVFIDPVSALYPEIEKSNPDATMIYQKFREVIRECACSIVNLHHPRKDSVLATPVSLEDDNFRVCWFQRVRGAGVLVNGADIRLGVDRPCMSGAGPVGKEEIALVTRGYGRVRGEIPTMHLARVLDAEGEPLGYRKVTAIKLLCNPEQEKAFTLLPDLFTFKEARLAYKRQDQATTDFLRKCITMGILQKIGHGQYEKVKVAE
jgi:hypothetical protein